MPAHCPEHTDGASYPSHFHLEGLMAAYYVTGNPDFKNVATKVGEKLLRWQKENQAIFYADARECGWPMLAFLCMHRHTGEQKWLDACEEIFQFYRERTNDEGEIQFDLPHRLGLVTRPYGNFMAWRGCFFYYERTQKEEVRLFLLEVLDKIYKYSPEQVGVGGWASNDLFPAWAGYTLSGEDRFIEDNYLFLRALMNKEGNFPWAGVDMHYYLAELDERGTLEGLQEG